MISRRRSTSIVYRRGAIAAAIVVLGIAFGCADEEARARKQLAGEYVSSVDHVVGGERARELHVLRLTGDGYWIRVGRTQIGERPMKASRDSGTYRVVDGTLLTLLSQLETTPMTMRYAVAGDTISGYNRAMHGFNKEAKFVRR